MKKETQERIEKLLTAMVLECCRLIETEPGFCFDVKFELGDKKYRLSMAEERSEMSYLKEN